MSSNAGGTASMTEPPTLRKFVICIARPPKVISQYNVVATGFQALSRRRGLGVTVVFEVAYAHSGSGLPGTPCSPLKPAESCE